MGSYAGKFFKFLFLLTILICTPTLPKTFQAHSRAEGVGMKKLVPVLAALLLASGSLFAVSGSWIGVGTNTFGLAITRTKYNGSSSYDSTELALFSPWKVQGAAYFGESGKFGIVGELGVDMPFSHTESSDLDYHVTNMIMDSGAMFSYKVFQKEKFGLDLNGGLHTYLCYSDTSSGSDKTFQIRSSGSAMFMYDLIEHVTLRAGVDMRILMGEWGDDDLEYKHAFEILVPAFLVYRF